eukprot:COSAG01_NODE_14317_length_1469_cov_4.972993_1_plen_56_part_01
MFGGWKRAGCRAAFETRVTTPRGIVCGGAREEGGGGEGVQGLGGGEVLGACSCGES